MSEFVPIGFFCYLVKCSRTCWLFELMFKHKFKFSHFFILIRRRKCDIEPRDRDSKASIMEPRDLSSSARLFPNAQIKIRWVSNEYIFELFIIELFFTYIAHLRQHRQHRTHHRPPPSILDHRIKDYRHRVQPRAVFIQSQLQEYRVLQQRVDTQHQYTLMWEEQSTHHRWKH